MAQRSLISIALLLTTCVAAQAVEGSAGRANAVKKSNPGPKPAPKCSDSVDSKSCKDVAGCVWCEATFGPGKKPKGSCYDEASAAWLPAIFKCSKPSTHATADSTTIIAAAIPHGHGPSKTTSTNQLAASTTNGAAASAGVKVAVASEPPSPVCADEVDRASCNDKAGCVWCEKGIMGMCFSQERAQWLPPQIFKCPTNIAPNPKEPAAAAAAAAPSAEVSCKAAADEVSCKDTADCVWCVGLFGPGKPPKEACYSQVKAQFLPAHFYHCSAPSADAAHLADEDAASAAAPRMVSCKDAANEVSCTGLIGCVWCEATFGPAKKPKAACYSQTKAQFLPAQFFKCAAPTTPAAPTVPDNAAVSGAVKVSCKGGVDKASCKDIAGCVWCEATFGPGKKPKAECYSQTKAQFLPSVFKCGVPSAVAVS